VVEALEVAAEQLVPGLTGEPAWPTLRAHLLRHTAHGTDPAAHLAATARARELTPLMTVPPWWTGGSTTPDTATPAGARCRGSPASPQDCATTRNGAPTWPPDPIWSPHWPTRLEPVSPTPTLPNGQPNAGARSPLTSSGRCRCGGPRCRSARMTGVPPARATAQGRPDLAAAPRPPGGWRPAPGVAGMGPAARPGHPRRDQGCVHLRARRPVGGDLPCRGGRVAAALFRRLHRWPTA
jgi:hypothetical protein